MIPVAPLGRYRDPHMLRRVLLSVVLLGAVSCSSREEPSGSGEDPTPTTLAAETIASTIVEPTQAPATTVAPDPMQVDYGVTDEVIRVGLSVDLTGPLADVTAAVVDAHVAYFDRVNDAGGIANRAIEVVVLDHASDLTTHLDNIAEFAERSEGGVALVASSGNDEFTVAATVDLAAGELLAVPRGWDHTLWTSPDGAALVPFGSSVCADAVNGVEFMVDQLRTSGEADADEVLTFAAVGRSGVYGESSVAAAELAATELGLDVVVAEAGVLGDGTSDLAEQFRDIEPDLVWVAGSPAETAVLITEAGLEGTTWGGHAAGYSPAVAESAAGPFVDGYIHVSPVAPAHASAEGLEMINELLPNASWAQSASLTVGLTQAMIVEAVLLQAAANEDLRRGGLVDALEAIDVTTPWLAESVTGSSSRRPTPESWVSIVDTEVATPTGRLAEPGSDGLGDSEVVRSSRVGGVCP